ncbi:hypothetical protein LWC05_05615 [Acetobacter sicerae]|uniref:Uncharacterized protein n=1 Tax=Acetobacter sicerae TaxID=85325 RepID=A0ABS8VT91_9PROT|nr:hypothetical protein [Acetobacter sicerae]MCE0743369.1 hypothetical protein [Acetobacter sicerae]
MTPTPEMIESALSAYSSAPLEMHIKDLMPEVIKAALAAWWKPMKPEPQTWLPIIAKRKTGHVVVVEKPDDRPWYDPFTEVEWRDLSFFIPLSDFEDRK